MQVFLMKKDEKLEDRYFFYKLTKRVHRLVLVSILGTLAVVGSIYWVDYLIERDLRKQMNFQMIHGESLLLSSINSAMREASKNYLLNKNTDYARLYLELANRGLNSIDKIRSNPLFKFVEKPVLALNSQMQAQAQQFDLVTLGVNKVGLTEKDGLQLKVRTAAHAMESLIQEIRIDALFVTLLMIRRYEKDFMVRGDRSSIIGMKQQINFLQVLLTNLPREVESKQSLQEILNTYIVVFQQLVEERVKLEIEIKKLDELAKGFSLVLDTTITYLKHQSESSAKMAMTDLLLFKSVLGTFAIFLVLLVGLQGILLIRQVSGLAHENDES